MSGWYSIHLKWLVIRGILSRHSHKISALWNSYGKFWAGMLDSALHHIIQTPKWDNFLWKMMSIPLVEFRLVASILPTCHMSYPDSLRTSFKWEQAHKHIDLTPLSLQEFIYDVLVWFMLECQIPEQHCSCKDTFLLLLQYSLCMCVCVCVATTLLLLLCITSTDS